MELDEEFLTAPPRERPPLPGDKEEGQECRAFHPSAVKAFKIQTRLNATTIAQEEAKKADQVEAVERSAAVLHELQGGAIDGGGDGGLLLKNLDLDLFREKLLDKLGADWGRPTPELLQAQTTAEEAKAKHQARQAKGSLETRMLEPITRSSSRQRHGGTSVWTTSHPTDSYLEAKAVISLGRNPFPAALLSDLLDLTGIPMPKAGCSGAARVQVGGGFDRPPTIPPASGSGDKPSATPVGLDTKDPEVQLSVLRWMMSKRVGEVRIFAGRWVRRPGPVQKPHQGESEKGTHPRNHQVGGLPWARYSVDELNQQAKAPTLIWGPAIHLLGSTIRMRTSTGRARLDTPRPTGMFGHSYTLRQLWGVWESLPPSSGARKTRPRIRPAWRAGRP